MSKQKKKTNVIFFMDDQHNAQCLGFMGHSMVKTPNLDALAAKGTYFNNMFTCTALCAPSRASFYSGTYLRTHEQFVNNVDSRRQFPTILSELKKQGYYTFQCGKNHLMESMSKDFDEMHTDRYYYDKYLPSKGLKEKDWTEPEIKKNFMSAVSDLPEEEQNEVWTANHAIDFLKSDKAQDNPFFMWCSFERPHAAHFPPASFDNLYNPEDIPIDWDAYYKFEQSRIINRPMIEDFWKIGSSRSNLEVFKKAVCRHLALITLIDQEIGRVLKALEKQGLADNTVIVFTADHGEFAGHYGQLGKNHPGYDDLLKIPFIYYDPQNEGYGRVVEGMFQSIDLFPSLMERLGLPVPPEVQGVSFCDALEGYPGSSREAVFAESSNIKTVRTREWKLNFNALDPHHGGQLFKIDRQVPEENVNLWNCPEYRYVRLELMEKLTQWMVSCEQPTGTSFLSEEYIDTRWYRSFKNNPIHSKIK